MSPVSFEFLTTPMVIWVQHYGGYVWLL